MSRFTTLTLLLISSAASAQDKLTDVTITSSKDQSPQHAMFWRPADADPNTDGKPVPLLVALHSWSADYKQSSPRDDFFVACRQRGWAIIHPNFRGPNVRPEACASDLAVHDVLDAVEYAKQHARVDESRIYLAGASGGGHMSLVMATKAPKLWAGVSAWVPITDLALWHQQCAARKLKYAKNLEAVCGGPPGNAKTDAEYRQRSSLFFFDRATGLPIDINAGIHDGHTGSVPINHSLLAFNALARANGQPRAVIADADIRSMVETQKPSQPLDPLIDAKTGRKYPILFRRTAGPVRVTLFDGGHAHDTQPAIEWLAAQRRK